MEPSVEYSDLKSLISNYDLSQPVPFDFLTRAKSLLTQYLGGSWQNLPIEKFQIKPLSGGLSNLIFLAKLPLEFQKIDMELHSVLIRIYSETNHHQLLQENLIFGLLSERKICPRLLGVFPGGRIEEYIPSRTLRSKEVYEDGNARCIAQKLAQVHNLDLPVSKSPELIRQLRPWLAKLETVLENGKMKLYPNQVRIFEDEYPTIITVEQLRTELAFVEAFLEKFESPVVFCHNDVWQSNILLRHLDENENEKDSLMLIDFEGSCYNYRGFDFGQYFCAIAWDFDSSDGYLFNAEKYEDLQLRETFCNAYLDEIELTHGVPLEREAELNHLIEECYTFMPIANFFYGCWSLFYGHTGLKTQGDGDSKKFDYEAFGRDQLILYYQQKKKYLSKYM